MPAGLPLQSRFLIMFILYGIRHLQSRTWICSKYSWKHPRPSLLVMYILPAVWLFHKKLKAMYISWRFLASQRTVLFVLRTIAEASAVFSGGSKRPSALSLCVCFFQNELNQIKSINPSVIQLKYDLKYVGEGLKPKS